MPEPDAFDPTHALDGWRPPPPAPVAELDLGTLLHPRRIDPRPPLIQAQPAGFDPTHLLDGWRPPAPPPLDLELKSLLHVGPVPDEAKLARLKARGYEMRDVEDIELVEAPAPCVVTVEAWVQEIPPTPPLAQADLGPVSLLEEVEQPEATVDLPLPDEPTWPLFVEEAQVLDAGSLPPIEPEAAPAFDGLAPVEAVDLTGEKPVPAVVDDTPVWEPQAAAAEFASLDEAAVPVVAEARESEGEVEPGWVEDVDLPEEPAPSLVTETPVVEPLVESVASMEVDPAQWLEDVAPAEAVPPVPVEAPAPDFPAPAPELPPFIGDIHLPPVAPPAEVEASVLDFRAAPPPPEPDPLSVIAGIELPRVAQPPAVVEMPELDIAALTPRPPEPDPRLLAHWQAGAWTALARQVAAASEELSQTPAGLRVESHAPQWLCAIWPPHPEEASLGRWPELAAVVAAETTAGALQQLLVELPDATPLWSANLEADWDLVAELVLHQDTGLRPAQARALREFAEAERDARRARFSEAYALQGHVARRCA